jgi:hypothetical protein
MSFDVENNCQAFSFSKVLLKKVIGYANLLGQLKFQGWL